MVLNCLEELDQLTGARVTSLNEQTYQLQKQTKDQTTLIQSEIEIAAEFIFWRTAGARKRGDSA